MKNMKHRIAAFLLASAVFAGMVQALPASAAEKVRLMGDMNDDDKITAADAQLTLIIFAESLVELSSNVANAENGSGDIDMNGVIDASDAQSILRYYCQTLVGEQPMWADFREVSFRDQYGEEIDGPQTDCPYTRKGMYLEIGCAQGAPGETVEIPVYLSGVNDLSGFQLFLQADDGLTLSDITSDLGLDCIIENMVYDPEELDEYVAIFDRRIEETYASCLADYGYLSENDADFDYASLEDYLAEFIADFTGKEPEGTDYEDFRKALLSDFFGVNCNVDGGAINWVFPIHLNPCNGLVIATYHYTIPEDAESGATYRITLSQDEDLVNKFIPCEPLDDDMSGFYWEYTLLDGVVVVE